MPGSGKRIKTENRLVAAKAGWVGEKWALAANGQSVSFCGDGVFSS